MLNEERYPQGQSRFAGKTKLMVNIRLRLTISFLLGLLAFAFVFSNSESSIEPSFQTPPSPPPDKFVIGCMNSWSELSPYSYYDSLGLNLQHIYLGTEWDSDLNRHTPFGWITGTPSGDHLTITVPITLIQNVLTETHIINESRFIWQRPKIEWLCFGQSSIYQAEPVAESDDLWFYAFNEHLGDPETDNSQWGGGRDVLFCDQSIYSAGLVVSRLKANTEQSKQIIGNPPAATNHWTGDSETDWYIKPRIRIDSAFAANNPNTNVCKIIVLHQNGDTLKKTIIKASNFSDLVTPYNGQYLEEFHGLTGSDSLIYNGSWGSEWMCKARGTSENDNGLLNKADIQVYWYDNCDMWIDYIKVENDVAHDLLSDTINNPQHEEYIQWIEDEVDAVMGYENGAAVYNYYIELFEFNNIPCMAYVADKINTLSGGKIGLMTDQFTYYRYHVPWANVGDLMDAGYIIRNYVDKVQPKQIFGGHYPLNSL